MLLDSTGLLPAISVPSTSSISAFISFDNKSFIDIFDIALFTFQ